MVILPTARLFTRSAWTWPIPISARLRTTPRREDYAASVPEIGALTVSDFLRTNRLQAAINANFFDGRNYYLPAGTPMDVYGVAISEGVVVSEQEGRNHAAAIFFDANNRPTVVHTNWPAQSIDGVYTAVAGNYPLVVAGKNIISRSAAHETEPRTVFGISQDRRYLFLVAIDGRQPGYSNGATDYESAGWFLLLGAYDGVSQYGRGRLYDHGHRRQHRRFEQSVYRRTSRIKPLLPAAKVMPVAPYSVSRNRLPEGGANLLVCRKRSSNARRPSW